MKRLFAFIVFAALACGQINQSTTGSLTASSGAGSTVAIGGLQNTGSVGVTVSGTWSATLVFEATVDGTNWFTVPGIVQSSNVGVLSTTANGQWNAGTAGMGQFRVRASAYSSGTAVVTIRKASTGFRVPEAFNSTGPAPIVACDSSATISVAAGATAKLVTGATGVRTYICGFSISGDTTATVAQFTKGTGTTCGTSTANVSGAYKLAANGTLASGDGLGAIFAPIAASTDFCLSATTGAVAGTIYYTQAP